MEEDKQSKTSLIIGLLIIVVIIVGIYLWQMKRDVIYTQPDANITSEEPQDLGSQLFNEVENPIKEEIPSVNAAPNPLEDIFSNPFQ